MNADRDLMCRKQTECRKYSHGHPSLSPGIFTVFCPHGICYGFQVMTKHESPEVPFDIFKTRFSSAPDVIIYDNACRLHAYCLNRLVFTSLLHVGHVLKSFPVIPNFCKQNCQFSKYKKKIALVFLLDFILFSLYFTISLNKPGQHKVPFIVMHHIY